MTTTSLLLLTSLLASPLAATDTVQPAAPPAQVRTADVLSAQLAAGQQFPAPEPRADLIGDSNDICFKIRAYIFKRDDDHAPVLTGSTTCGPRQPREKDVAWPKARLVPAD